MKSKIDTSADVDANEPSKPHAAGVTIDREHSEATVVARIYTTSFYLIR
jgi:hypothetical protein